MRLNRNIRIGAFFVALALVGLGLLSILRSLRPNNPPPVANAPLDPDVSNSAPQPIAGTYVAVARRDIPERSIVTPEMLEMQIAPVGLDSRPFVTDMEGQAVGFITARPITRGRQVRQGDLVGHISDVGIAGALLPGRRAMILPIGNKNTLHELVRIGDRVDIVAAFDGQEARAVAEDVRVLAVDVFGSDYPQVKVAMRGDYKAPARSYSSAVPSSPTSTGGASTGAQNTASNPDTPPGQQNPAGASGSTAGASAAAAPTPTQGPAPARPEPALTIEVTPQQATDIALTQAAGQNIDYLLRPRSEPRLVPGAPGGAGGAAAGGVTLASTGDSARSTAFSTRERLAPYAARVKRGTGTASGASAARSAGSGASGGSSRSAGADAPRPPRRADRASDYIVPPIPNVPTIGDVPPAPIPDGARVTSVPPVPPATYDIPIYGDGKLVRVDTVKRPRQ